MKDFGAKGDGKTLDTAAIAAALGACSSAGGGTVLFPAPGVYLTGAFNLTSNLVLTVQKGATISASTDPSLFPLVEALPSYPNDGGRCSIQLRPLMLPRTMRSLCFAAANTSPRYQAFVFGSNLTNVTITGGGIIDGNGRTWWKVGVIAFRWKLRHAILVRLAWACRPTCSTRDRRCCRSAIRAA